MSATASGQSLDAFSGRDVVFCHACENEWFQDQHGLVCPRCHSEATEIVTSENDPRPANEHDDSDPNTSAPQSRRDRYDDSDPEEEDIEEHSRRAPGGILFTSRVFRMPLNQGTGTQSSHLDPADGDGVMEQFLQMMGRDFGHPSTSGGTSSEDPSSTAGQGSADSGSRHTTTRTTLFPGGSTSFTITTAPLQRDGPSPPIGDFDAILSAIMGNITNPTGNSPLRGDNADSEGRNLPPHGHPVAFHQLLGALMAGSGGTRNWGDVVTSQEEFDRIISQMMESNPMSNAAPPASQAAIEKLERKNLDQKMLGTDDKVECTICMDDLSLGDEATVLPCRHFFHGDCVSIWLKEHNTCPICRNPIEERSSAERAPAAPSQQFSMPTQPRTIPPRALFPWVSQPARSEPWSYTSSSHVTAPDSRQAAPVDTEQNEGRSNSGRRELLRSPSTNEERLRAIRDVANTARHGGSDPPNMQDFGGRRRDSLSPPSPSLQAPWNLSYDPVHDYTSASRDRARERDGDRGGSQSNTRFGSTNREDGHRERERHRQHTNESSRQAGHEPRDQERSDGNSSSRRSDTQQTNSGSSFDPFGWIRDRLPGGGNSSGDGHRRT